MSPKEESSKILFNAASVPPPREFDFTKPERWTQWITRFERYMLITNLSTKTDLEKINAMCYIMGEKSKLILSSVLPCGVNIFLKYEDVKTRFNQYFFPKKNANTTLAERFKFNTRTQQVGESVDSFITDLYVLVETCDFGALKDSLIRDRIVVGISDSLTSRFLQLLTDLTVTKAIEVAREAEEHNKKQTREEYKIERNLVHRFSWKELIINSKMLRSYIGSVIDAISKPEMPDCIRHIAAGFEISARLRTIHNLIIYGITTSQYEVVAPLGKSFLKDVEESSGRNHPDVAAMLALLALVYQHQEKYEEAENLLDDALAIRVKIFGENHNAVASTFNNFAELYCKQANFKDAERMCRRALAIRQKELGHDHRDVAKQLNNFSLLCDIQGKYDDAVRYCQQAVEIYEAKLGPDHYIVYNTKFNLANCYDHLGKTDEAKTLRAETVKRSVERAFDPILD